MRKKRKNNNLTIMIIVFIISTFTLSIGYSLLYEKLSVQGTGNLILPEEDSDVTSEYLSFSYKINGWYSEGKYYYQIDTILENISEYTIENWKVVLEIPNLISVQGGWNGEFSTSSEKVTITPVIYNQTISPGNNIAIGLQIITSSDILEISKIKLYGTPIGVSNVQQISDEDPEENIPENNVETNDPPSTDDNIEVNGFENNGLNVQTSLKMEWLSGNKYLSQHNITVTNITADTIEDWLIKIEMPEGVDFSQIWEGNYINMDGILKISGVSYNKTLQPNESANILIQFESVNEGYIPQIINE